MSKKRENKEKRLVYIRNLMETTGSTRVNASEIARLFEVSETVIRGDLKEIYKEMNEKSKESVAVELTKIDMGLKRGMRELEKIVESDRKPEEKLKAIEIYSKMASDYVSSKSRLGLFQPDGKGSTAPAIICFTYGSCLDNSFIEYCVKAGHPEVKVLFDSFETLRADEEVKAAIERQERLHPGERHVVVDTSVLSLDEIDKSPEDGNASDALETAPCVDCEPPGEYYCRACKKNHPNGTFCFAENELRKSEQKNRKE